ncbi:MAG: hypothetical protein ACM3QS_17250 [Bacteroidota bacterium]
MNSNLRIQLLPFLRSAISRRGALFGGILVTALLAFEVFNFSTTSFALRDVLGDLLFLGMRWSTVLAVAFCGIDFAGIARIFTPEQGRDEPAEVWYLFGAWLLAATFNAMLTWWGVSVAILNHNAIGGVLLGTATMTKVVPIFVAVMVWLVRVLIIGTFSLAGERLFTSAESRPYQQRPAMPSRPQRVVTQAEGTAPSYPRPAARPVPSSGNTVPRPPINRPEPTYHPVGVTARGDGDNQSSRS